MLLPIISLLVVAAAAVALRERHMRTHAEIQHHFLEQIILGNSHPERYTEQLSLLSGRMTKHAAAELVSSLTPILYRVEANPIESIAHSLHLTRFLLTEAYRSGTARRAHLLSIASRIPPTDDSTELLEHFTRSESRDVRLFALLTQINSDQQNALRHIAAYPFAMTQFEIAQLVSLLRQGLLVVAYPPMLGSSSENLQLLGLAIVRHFSIEGAEGELHEMIRSGTNYAISREVLYTIASMQLPLDSLALRSFVLRMPPRDKARFIRYAVCEGYSQGAIESLGITDENKKISSLINSYKIRIRCFQHSLS